MELFRRAALVEFQRQNRAGFQRFQGQMPRLRHTNVRRAVDKRVPKSKTRPQFRNDQADRTRSREARIRSERER